MIPSGKMGGTIACLGLQLMLVSNASAQGQQPPSPGQMGQDGAYTVGSGVTTPTVLTHAAPHVPELALKLHAAGDVLLSLVVKADRSIRDVQVVRSVGYGMDEEAIETVKKWRFSAGTKDGIPVDIRIRVEVGFREAPNSRVWGAGPIVFGLPTGSTAPRLKSGLMPKSASQAGDEIVVLQFTLNSVGETGDIRALQGLDSPSLQMLIKSLSAWTFEPSPGIVAPVVGKVLLIKGEDQFRYTVAEAFRNLGSVPPAEPVTAAAPSPGQVPASSSKTITVPVRLELDSDEAARLLVERVPPQYPDPARHAGVEGDVLLEITIGEDGSVKNAKPIEGPPELISAAIEAVKRWKYRPAVSRGRAWEAKTEVKIQFKLSE
jgi:TonB family protein